MQKTIDKKLIPTPSAFEISLKEKAEEMLIYNNLTGIFIRKKTSGGKKIGTIAGGINKISGYIILRLDGKKYPAHRIAFLMTYGYLPMYIDHKNQDRKDNRITNLREVTFAENMQNKTKYNNNSSGITGVIWDKKANKWRVRLWIDKKMIHIGRFINFADAKEARDAAYIKYGFHKNHGKDKK